jgi:hypothetical protein
VGAAATSALHSHLLLRAPAAALLTRVAAALTALGASARVSASEGLSVKGKLGGGAGAAGGEVALRVTVFAAAPGASVCEMHRSKGGAQECGALQLRLQAALADLCILAP